MTSDAAAATPNVVPRYPLAPWDLTGRMHLTVWRVPRDDLPAALATATPPGVTPVGLGGDVLVGTAFVRYGPGSVLRYDELLAAVLVHARGRPCVTVPHMWVDHEGSRWGGRELWAIPKQLARFERAATSRTVRFRAATEAGVLAELVTATRARLPGRWPVPLRTVQQLDDVVRAARVRGSAQLALARSHWRFPREGPLGYLADRRALVHLDLRRFGIRVGTSVV